MIHGSFFICADKSNENSFDTDVLIQIKMFVCKQFQSPPYVVLDRGDGYLKENCILSEVVHACDFIQVPILHEIQILIY